MLSLFSWHQAVKLMTVYPGFDILTLICHCILRCKVCWDMKGSHQSGITAKHIINHAHIASPAQYPKHYVLGVFLRDKNPQ